MQDGEKVFQHCVVNILGIWGIWEHVQCVLFTCLWVSFWGEFLVYGVSLFGGTSPLKNQPRVRRKEGGIADFQHSIDIAKHTELKPNGVRNPPKTYEIEIRG